MAAGWHGRELFECATGSASASVGNLSKPALIPHPEGGPKERIHKEADAARDAKQAAADALKKVHETAASGHYTYVITVAGVQHWVFTFQAKAIRDESKADMTTDMKAVRENLKSSYTAELPKFTAAKESAGDRAAEDQAAALAVAEAYAKRLIKGAKRGATALKLKPVECPLLVLCGT